MRADLHTHTLFSFDGAPAATVDAMCESAIAKGIGLLAITDHCDINGEIEGIYAILDKEAVFRAIEAAKKKYANRLQLLFGIELGQATQYPREAAALLSRYPYDIVLGSLHNLANTPDFYYMSHKDAEISAIQLADASDAEITSLFHRVLDESAQLLDFPGIHVLAHLTYMHRYVLQVGKTLDFKPFFPELTALFQKMIQKGIALELNTSTVGKRGITMPTKELLALYHSCGGRLITLGSDAHTPNAIAQHFNSAAESLLDCGFTELAFPTANGLITLPIPKGERYVATEL
ncbi:MAG: histidinol-phosphatase HisJ family protein [Ruminococcaceae bacterium]|nr:histidinol-phosphatase HisJ family protein [Oscillospiraceae bacterium]